MGSFGPLGAGEAGETFSGGLSLAVKPNGRVPRLESYLHLSPALCPERSTWTSLCLSFLSYKIRIRTAPALGWHED